MSRAVMGRGASAVSFQGGKVQTAWKGMQDFSEEVIPELRSEAGVQRYLLILTDISLMTRDVGHCFVCLLDN